jgi:malate synthase
MTSNKPPVSTAGASGAAIQSRATAPAGLQILGRPHPAQEQVLSAGARDFLVELHGRFEPTRRALLSRRKEVQRGLDQGRRLDFRADTAALRQADWKIAAPPRDLTCRLVEITGPVERKMIINALNSGADVFMADFEDSNSPTWANCLEGQRNLIDAVRRQIRYESPEGKRYELAERTATLVVRPRGWHLEERHVAVDGQPMSAALFDFGLYCFHNARELVRRGTGPYFYLPKLEACEEARLWNEVFVHAQAALGLPRGTIRATVLIETLPAAFEMDEILYELREHSSGLNCGRWDYIFSFIKKHRAHPACILPDRFRVGMTEHFLRSYSLRLIQTCHRRGAHAMGGMAAQIPIKNDPQRNAAALEKVRADKRREAQDGHDGTWVAHPGLVAIAREEFQRALPSGAVHQFSNLRTDVRVEAEDLLRVPSGPRTEEGLRHNLRVGVQYLAAWLSGTGCVPLYDLMEDAATAEISRAQVWQWLRHGARLEDGQRVERALVARILDQEVTALRAAPGPLPYPPERLEPARALFERLLLETELSEFLTSFAYETLLAHGD